MTKFGVYHYSKNIYEDKSKPNLTTISDLDYISMSESRGTLYGKKNAEVSPSSSCDIHRIEVEYLRDEAKRKKKALVDTSLVVDVESTKVGPTPPTSAVETSSIPTPSTSTVSALTLRPPLTQAMIYKMGSLSHSTNVRASHVEAVVPAMIEHAIAEALAPIQEKMMGQHTFCTAYGKICRSSPLGLRSVQRRKAVLST